MNPYYTDTHFTLYQADCLDVLTTLPDNSIDAVVTDPPYGLSNHSIEEVLECLRAWIAGEEYRPRKGKSGFMGKGWDAWVPGPEIWKECYRVLKPGGHMLVFAGTRSMDLMSMAIRLAGFELRDTCMWLYGSGFPKSHDVSKAIDKEAGAEREVVGYDVSRARPNRLYEGGAIGNIGGTGKISDRTDNGATITASATDAAKQWSGWGTALKPAYEPILMCRKPLEGTVAQNVLEHGTGAINIDGCRISGEPVPINKLETWSGFGQKVRPDYTPTVNTQGRWPANIILSHSPDCKLRGMKKVRGTSTGNGNAPVEEEGSNIPLRRGSFVDRTDENGMEEVEDWECVEGCPIREFPESKTNRIEKPVMCDEEANTWGGTFQRNRGPRGYNESGSAARFFYCAKASRKERNAGLETSGKEKEAGVRAGNSHPT